MAGEEPGCGGCRASTLAHSCEAPSVRFWAIVLCRPRLSITTAAAATTTCLFVQCPWWCVFFLASLLACLRLFMGTEHALRNIQELKLTLKILVQYLRNTLLQGPSPTAADIQGLFDLLLVFVTQRTGGRSPCACACPCVRIMCGVGQFAVVASRTASPSCAHILPCHCVFLLSIILQTRTRACL